MFLIAYCRNVRGNETDDTMSPLSQAQEPQVKVVMGDITVAQVHIHPAYTKKEFLKFHSCHFGKKNSSAMCIS